MSPSSTVRSRAHYTHSRGFLVPLSAILLLGISVLAVAINRISAQSSHASIAEGVAIQAFYAAESGAYYGMNQLMFDVEDRSVADTNCTALSASTLTFTAAGLQNCTASISCTISSVTGSPLSFYQVRSEASCGADDIFSQRIIEVSSSL